MNYVAGIGYDKGDNNYHYSFYAKRVLIVAFSEVHVQIRFKPWIKETSCGMSSFFSGDCLSINEDRVELKCDTSEKI